MARSMCANVMMEEGYMRMSVEFNNAADRDKIETSIAKHEKEMDLSPSVIRRNISDDAGNFSIEFPVDNNSRECGAFFEGVMKDCGIDKCEA